MSVKEWALELYEKHGKLTPEIVREAARPVDSPAHAFVFGLPPEEAAEEYYLLRAHKLIQSVKVTVQRQPDEPPRRVRFFYATPGTDEQFVYQPLPVVIGDPQTFNEVRRQALRRLSEAEEALTDLDSLVVESAKSSTRRARNHTKEARRIIEGQIIG